MTVKELIEKLQSFDSEMDVVFTYNYGDLWRTPVAVLVDWVEDGTVTESKYHNMDRLVDDEEDRPKDARDVVVLS